MKLIKSILLGTSAGLLAVAGAQAADLPSRKSAPVEYVKICDAYGAGFFFIPGTDTCLKIGGRARADFIALSGNNRANNSDTIGYHIRANITLDARTQTAWGTVQTVANMRMQRDAGVSATGNGIGGFGVGTVLVADAAYIRWAGITAGLAYTNFPSLPLANMDPSWRSLVSTSIAQLAYTATFGGGFSATIALQDHVNAASSNVLYGQAAGAAGAAAIGATTWRYPDVVANLRVDQAWGSAFVGAAYSDIRASLAATPAVALPGAPFVTFNQASKAGYAVTGGVILKLPMLAAGDEIGATVTWARGAIDYLGIGPTQLGSGVAMGGNQVGRGTLPRYSGVVNAAGGIDLSSGWSVAGYLKHYWTPSVRQLIFASYLDLKNPLAMQSALLVNPANTLGSVKETKIGTALIWSPVTAFDIGLELTYTRLRESNPTAIGANVIGGNPVATTVGAARSGNGLSTRLRLERLF